MSSDQRKRGRPPKSPGERTLSQRKIIALDANSQQVLALLQEKLTSNLGFRPTIAQTVMWLAVRANVEN